VYGGREFTRDLLSDNIEITKQAGRLFKKHEMVYIVRLMIPGFPNC
jgi:hypothetical protein